MATEKRSSEKNRTSTVSEEIILKVSKEVVIKFIEVGRVTPNTFNETFANIHTTIKNSVNK